MNRLPLCAGMLVLFAVTEVAAHPPLASAPQVTVTPEGRKADLAEFRSKVLRRDRSYAAEARAQAESRLAKLEADAAQVSQAYFELELARIVALADNGHTISFAAPRSRRYDRVGLRLVPFAEDFFVMRAKEAEADLLGARLVAIGARPIAALRDAARTLAGGTPAWRDRNAGYFLESPEQLHALGLVDRPDSVVYRFQLPDGREVARRLQPEPASPHRVRANASRWLYPVPAPGEDGAWRALVAADQVPWSLRDPDQPFRWREAPELGAVVIELRQNNGSDAHPIGRFLDEMTRVLRDRKPRHLVLDMRMNGGGDLNTTRDFMQRLPGLVPGRIFALTGPWTFSAAISSVGYLEQAAPDRVTIVGEPVGDRLRMWSEGEIVELPHSHAMILFANERHDYLTGCLGFPDCHGNVVRHPIAVPDLDPDIAAPWTIEAYRAGRDPGMDAIAAALRAGG